MPIEPIIVSSLDPVVLDPIIAKFNQVILPQIETQLIDSKIIYSSQNILDLLETDDSRQWLQLVQRRDAKMLIARLITNLVANGHIYRAWDRESYDRIVRSHECRSSNESSYIQMAKDGCQYFKFIESEFPVNPGTGLYF